MTALDLHAYRTTYDIEFWRKQSEEVGHCSAPFGAVLAVNALCNEVERLRNALSYYTMGGSNYTKIAKEALE